MLNKRCFDSVYPASKVLNSSAGPIEIQSDCNRVIVEPGALFEAGLLFLNDIFQSFSVVLASVHPEVGARRSVAFSASIRDVLCLLRSFADAFFFFSF